MWRSDTTSQWQTIMQHPRAPRGSLSCSEVL
jgi:hypothetical protein